jgi:hypothetical protein
MELKTKDLNAALLELGVLVGRHFPTRRASEMGSAFRWVARELRHHGLLLQAGTPAGGDPRDLLRLALVECFDCGVPSSDVAQIVNDHQRGHATPVKQDRAS